MSDQLAARVSNFEDAVKLATTAISAGVEQLKTSAAQIADISAKLAGGDAPTEEELAALDNGIAVLNAGSSAMQDQLSAMAAPAAEAAPALEQAPAEAPAEAPVAEQAPDAPEG